MARRRDFSPSDDGWFPGGVAQEMRVLGGLGLLGYPLDGTAEDVAAWEAKRAELAALDSRTALIR